MVTLFVTGLEFYAYHGVSAEERSVGHRYILDLEMEVDGKAEKTDNVADTVDYGSAAQIAIETATKQGFFTVERLAQVIGETLLQRLPLLQEVSIRVAKLNPPMPVIAEEAGVEVIVRR